MGGLLVSVGTRTFGWIWISAETNTCPVIRAVPASRRARKQRQISSFVSADLDRFRAEEILLSLSPPQVVSSRCSTGTESTTCGSPPIEVGAHAMWLSAPASSSPRAVEGVAASGRSPCYFICATRSAADLNRLPKKATTSPMASPLPVIHRQDNAGRRT